MQASIGRKLQYTLIGSVTVLWLGVVGAVTGVVHHETEEIFNSSLQETSQRVLSLAIHDLEATRTQGRLDISEPAAHDEYLTYQVFNRSGQMLMRSHGAPERPFSVPLEAGYHVVGRQHFNVESSSSGDYTIQVAERAGHRDETFYSMLLYLLLPLGALLPLTAVVIRSSVKSSLRAILRFEQDISTRSSRDLQPLDCANLPVELLGLGESVNSLLHRLQLALSAERSFTANSAHELRTPIAAALAQLDVLRGELAGSPGAVRVAAARKTIEGLECTTVKLLQLARAESGTGLRLSRMDLGFLVSMLVRDISFRSMRRFELALPDQPVWIYGDMDAIGIAIQNLLENADRYAPSDTAVVVELGGDGSLSIMNDSEAIPAPVLETLCGRFVRASQAGAGSGIGLSIVDTILEQCQARLVLQSPCNDGGRGFAARVAFRGWEVPT